jgi:hypothetical protein
MAKMAASFEQEQAGAVVAELRFERHGAANLATH